MVFIHPGKLFIEIHKNVESLEDVFAYTEFLKVESGINGNLPVDISAILNHFQIPIPILKPLSGIQGLLLDKDRGIIVLNSTDPSSRQKFTQAHELIEFLFSVLPNGSEFGNGWKLNKPGGYKESTKEFICNLAAANLLMPYEYINQLINQQGVNFDCARIISDECEISLSAALVHLARLSPGNHSIVLWTLKNKPSEIKNCHTKDQMCLFDDNISGPAKKIRVEWSMGSQSAPFIPKNKSIEESSLINKAWSTGLFTEGKERLDLGGRKSAFYQTQNWPFKNNGETQVLSLIEYLG
ncbi:MAG: hypothetical protein CVU42_05090 [Chloroflexi bacterium HGW-Chloroflexi-4]|jgi:hypothetical protein|nr:MAG: hypothetical protein CVU42_05090 [Chloroflexi bacterium HGW-Chloroflexi-4]